MASTGQAAWWSEGGRPVKIPDAIAGHDFGPPLQDDDMVTDCIILARVTRMSDGRSSFVMRGNQNLDAVIRAGMLSVACQIDDGGWEDMEDDE